MTTPAGGGVFSQGFTIAGHKIPYAAAGVVVAIIGILVVLRARSTGSAVVAAGNPAVDTSGYAGTSGAAASFQPYATMGDLSTGLADLRNAITTGQLVPSAPAGTAPAPASYVGLSGATVPDEMALIHSQSWATLQTKYSAQDFGTLWNLAHPGVPVPGDITGNPAYGGHPGG